MFKIGKNNFQIIQSVLWKSFKSKIAFLSEQRQWRLFNSHYNIHEKLIELIKSLMFNYLIEFLDSSSGIVASCFSPGLVVKPSNVNGFDLCPLLIENAVMRKLVAEGKPSMVMFGWELEIFRMMTWVSEFEYSLKKLFSKWLHSFNLAE